MRRVIDASEYKVVESTKMSEKTSRDTSDEKRKKEEERELRERLNRLRITNRRRKSRNRGLRIALMRNLLDAAKNEKSENTTDSENSSTDDERLMRETIGKYLETREKTVLHNKSIVLRDANDKAIGRFDFTAIF